MIPVKEKYEIEGNLPGEEVVATIGDPRMVMKSLTKLYSNTALATIREYSTNARDANVEAGRSDVPIEVTLPTILDPYFTVKDTGVGLSTAELKEIYVSYGTSTKRGSNDYNGMLGFGSKSALAYTNTFTVTAIKDGTKSIAVITRKEDYSVVLKVVSTSKTEEINGVAIKVPVQDHAAFSRIARDFYRFWVPGTILIDGQEHVQAVGELIADNLYYSTADTSYVVMGNVGYRIENPDPLFKKTKPVHFVAYVPNGSVEFTPSREDLEYSEATKATLYKVIEDFEASILETAKKRISEKTDPFEAYIEWTEWTGKLGASLFEELTFDGKKFKSEVTYIKGIKYLINEKYRKYKTDNINHNWFKLTVKIVNSSLLITDYHYDKVHTAHRHKIQEYVELKGFRPDMVYFIPRDNDNDWVNPERVIKWNDLLAAIPKKPKVKKVREPSNRIPGSFDYYDQDGKRYTGQELPEGAEVYWYSIADDKKFHSINMAATYLRDKKVKGFTGDFAIVKIQANRLAKFQRENPTTENFYELCLKHEVTDGASLLSDEAKLAIWLKESNWIDALDTLNGNDILDKEWNAFVRLANTNADMLNYEQAQKFMQAIGKPYDFNRFYVHKMKNVTVPFAGRYPLLEEAMLRYGISNSLRDEWVIYMNDTYRRKVKK